MSKKTALDLACEELVESNEALMKIYFKLNDCADMFCPFGKRSMDCEHHHFNNVTQPKIDEGDCASCGRQHFQKQAEVPDGWEVVKTAFNKLNKIILNEEQIRENSFRVCQLLKAALDEAEIEVE